MTVSSGSLPPRRGWLVTAVAWVMAALPVGLLGACDAPWNEPDPENVESLLSSEVDQAFTECRRSWLMLQGVLTTMEPTMHQWEMHIEAMNRLVGGQISLTQAQNYWNQTRIAARHHYDLFARADERLRSRRAPCAVPSVQKTQAETAALISCDRAVTAALATLAAARTTLATWDRHITEMNMLRDGTLSPAAAQRKWIKVWRTGDENLQLFHQRKERSDALACGVK